MEDLRKIITEWTTSGGSEIPAKRGTQPWAESHQWHLRVALAAARILLLSVGSRNTTTCFFDLADTRMIQFSAPNNLAHTHTPPPVSEIRVELSYLLDLEVKSRTARDSDTLTSSCWSSYALKPVVGTCDTCAPKWTSSRVFLVRSVQQIRPAGWQPATRAPVHGT